MRIIKPFCKFLSAVLLMLSVWTFQHVFMLPDHMVMLCNQSHTLPAFVRARASEDDFLLSDEETGTITPTRTGEYTIDLSVFGLFQKTATAEVREPVSVCMGGQTLGIKLHMAGVLVIGMSEIPGSGGQSPGKDAGIAVGDRITAVNGTPLANADELEQLVTESGGQPLTLSVQHENETRETAIVPVYYTDGGSYKLGLWVRGSTAGIGTMTFIAQDSRLYAALGHAIEDMDTGTMVEVGDGTITKCHIVCITRGERGAPGELSGVFGEEIGTIETNTPSGLFGRMDAAPTADVFPIGVGSQVKRGAAYLYSGVGGAAAEPYEIEIERVFRQKAPGSKNMVIHVTDNRLLSLTGGIVQGMSGSPVVQNGKLVGAVTHVFVNDPTRGYGIFVENMLEETEKINRKD